MVTNTTPTTLGPAGTWHIPPWSVADFYQGVWGDDTGRVWAVGQVWGGRKGIAYSEDFGRTWVAQDRPNQHGLSSIDGDDEGGVWAVGSAGTVLRTERDTQHWKRIRAGLTGQLSCVYCRQGRELYVGDMSGGVVRSEDAGRTWAKVFQAPSCVRKIHGRPGHPIYAVGKDWTVFRSLDGFTWHDVTPTIAPGLSYHTQQFDSVATAPDGTTYVGGWQGTLVRTRNQGETWDTLAIPVELRNMPVSAIAIDDAGRVFATTYDAILRSDDGGDSFEIEYKNPRVEHHLWHQALWVGSQGDAVAVGSHGTMVVRQR